MTQPIQFSVDEAAARIEPAAVAGSEPLAGRDSIPMEIADVVTLSQEALAAVPASNLLPFAGSNQAALTREADHTAISSGGSLTQALLGEGYSLAQIGSEFYIPLAELESKQGRAILDTAA